ncbi:hypothetical protein Rhow_003242 [Rhodococcus wratislaviensis]|uniref:Uncharacterized protein n=1 Tax=Rhodococcus wratislaviensis TaxID=44752 RepID=A0A402BZ71_RHOWR|nr:hypothetical protein Rhow_003242 [Rhodococcus wratislaviensis]
MIEWCTASHRERSLAMSMDTFRTQTLRRTPLAENPDPVRNA